jgi:hypothetical protein
MITRLVKKRRATLTWGPRPSSDPRSGATSAIAVVAVVVVVVVAAAVVVVVAAALGDTTPR